MPLIDLDENSDMFKDIASNCKQKDGSEFVNRLDREWRYACMNWINAKLSLQEAEKVEKITREELIQASKFQNSKGCGVKAQKIIRKGSIQYGQIPELQGVNLDEYRDMPSESWRITLDE